MSVCICMYVYTHIYIYMYPYTSNPTGQADETITVHVVFPWLGITTPFTVQMADTIGYLKFQVQCKQGIPRNKQILNFDGNVMENDETMSTCNLSNDDTINCSLRISGGARTKGITKTEKVSLCEHKFQAMLKILKKPNPNAMEKLVMLLKDSQEMPPESMILQAVDRCSLMSLQNITQLKIVGNTTETHLQKICNFLYPEVANLAAELENGEHLKNTMYALFAHSYTHIYYGDGCFDNLLFKKIVQDRLTQLLADAESRDMPV